MSIYFWLAIAFVVIAVVMALWMKWEYGFFKVLIWALIGFFLTWGLIVGITTSKPCETETSYEKNEIASAFREIKTEGNFILGCGSINGNSYFVFYEKNPNGSYSFKQVNVESIQIFEENTTPYVSYEVITSYYKNKNIWTGKTNGVPLTQPQKSLYPTSITVPKNTITRTFKLQ